MRSDTVRITGWGVEGHLGVDGVVVDRDDDLVLRPDPNRPGQLVRETPRRAACFSLFSLVICNCIHLM